MDTIRATLFDALVIAVRTSRGMSVAGSEPMYVTPHAFGFRVSGNKPWAPPYYMARVDNLFFFPVGSVYVDGYPVTYVRPNMGWGAYWHVPPHSHSRLTPSDLGRPQFARMGNRGPLLAVGALADGGTGVRVRHIAEG